MAIGEETTAGLQFIETAAEVVERLKADPSDEIGRAHV